MNNDVTIRPYESRDRAAVRQICCDTADGGEPVERFFPDREVFADLITRYYTDHEPQSTWVAERDGKVVGYLTGCLDTRRFLRLMAWWYGPLIFLKAIGRGTLWHPQIVKLLSANLGGWLRGGFRRGVSLHEYPAHLHINLQKDARGQRVGPRLIRSFVEQVTAAGIHGIHAGVSADNQQGCRFFEAAGFTPLAREVRFRSPDTQRVLSTEIYGRKV
jgi:ribosomal protein S18 acetylase RimI-like enzyme